MKNLTFLIVALISLAFYTACGNKNEHGDFPSDFNTLSESQKVQYVMDNATPDSVARFICDAAIGRIPGVKLDSVPIVTLYVYEHYKQKDQDLFSNEYEKYSRSFSLSDKSKLLFKAAADDPMQIGYTLGLEYVGQIRENHKTVQEVEAEIQEFKRACGSDRETYDRFLKGFKIALEADRGKDLPEEVYRKFINYN
ncbi:MAG: hypothetical protein NC097_03960 [Clostridium sp.]|nr:hypothetical protein [Prevotella sp.]MCM1378135.1 hypothetical protein [Prevotella sp.]MCM1428931.1 hypothetical protein [Clostridium sp.]MCM1475965.1 hypothetical protein [Muribaculaceae bacterium]